MMPLIFPMVFKSCDKEGTLEALVLGKGEKKEITWLCETHFPIFWGYFVLPDVLRGMGEVKKEVVKDGS